MDLNDMDLKDSLEILMAEGPQMRNMVSMS